jgi:hypothetical protein
MTTVNRALTKPADGYRKTVTANSAKVSQENVTKAPVTAQKTSGEAVKDKADLRKSVPVAQGNTVLKSDWDAANQTNQNQKTYDGNFLLPGDHSKRYLEHQAKISDTRQSYLRTNTIADKEATVERKYHGSGDKAGRLDQLTTKGVAGISHAIVKQADGAAPESAMVEVKDGGMFRKLRQGLSWMKGGNFAEQVQQQNDLTKLQALKEHVNAYNMGDQGPKMTDRQVMTLLRNNYPQLSETELTDMAKKEFGVLPEVMSAQLKAQGDDKQSLDANLSDTQRRTQQSMDSRAFEQSTNAWRPLHPDKKKFVNQTNPNLTETLLTHQDGSLFQFKSDRDTGDHKGTMYAELKPADKFDNQALEVKQSAISLPDFRLAGWLGGGAQKERLQQYVDVERQALRVAVDQENAKRASARQRPLTDAEKVNFYRNNLAAEAQALGLKGNAFADDIVRQDLGIRDITGALTGASKTAAKDLLTPEDYGLSEGSLAQQMASEAINKNQPWAMQFDNG